MNLAGFRTRGYRRLMCYLQKGNHSSMYVCCVLFLKRTYVLVHGQVTIIFVVSVGLSVCLFVQSFYQPSLIRFRSN